MPKSLTKLLLKSLRRMGKAQQAQGTKLLKSLLPKLSKSARVPALKLAKPKPVKRVAPARPVKAGAAKSLSTSKPAPYNSGLRPPLWCISSSVSGELPSIRSSSCPT